MTSRIIVRLIPVAMLAIIACGPRPDAETAAVAEEPAPAPSSSFELGTYAWDYGPWMSRFANDLKAVWTAPHAYRIGIVSGSTKLRLTVEKDGTLSRVEVLERNGHERLHRSSVEAVERLGSLDPLPADFPEDVLSIALTMHYPDRRNAER